LSFYVSEAPVWYNNLAIRIVINIIRLVGLL